VTFHELVARMREAQERCRRARKFGGDGALHEDLDRKAAELECEVDAAVDAWRRASHPRPTQGSLL